MKWNIGAGVYKDSSFYLNFTGQKSQPVAITLTVYKHRNSCYPNDDTIKTETRYIHFLPQGLFYEDSTLAFGSYYGYYDGNTSDTGIISIRYVNSGPLPYPNIVVEGVVKGCADYYCCSGHGIGTIQTYYKGLYFETGAVPTATCQGANGALYYNPITDSMISNYALSNNNTTHQFRGKKIH